MVSTKGFDFRPAFTPAHDLPKSVPDTEQGDKIGAGHHKSGLGQVRLGLFGGWALPWILDAQGRGDQGHIRQASPLVGFQEHAGEPGIQGQPRHEVSFGGNAIAPPTGFFSFGRFDGAQLQKQLDNAAPNPLAHREDVREVADGLAGMCQQCQQQVQIPAEHLRAVARLLARARAFAQMSEQQQAVSRAGKEFEEKLGECSRVEEMKMRGLADGERGIHDALDELEREMPGLIDDLPEDKQYDELRQTARDFLEKLRESPKQELPHSVLLKRMKTDARTFHEIVNTLEQRGDIETVTAPRRGTYQRSYRFAGNSEAKGET